MFVSQIFVLVLVTSSTSVPVCSVSALFSGRSHRFTHVFAFSVFSTWGRVWHGQERHRHCCHVGDEAGADHEVHHPCGHGGYHRHLRFGGGRTDRQQHFSNCPSLQVSHKHVCMLVFCPSFICMFIKFVLITRPSCALLILVTVYGMHFYDNVYHNVAQGIFGVCVCFLKSNQKNCHVTL